MPSELIPVGREGGQERLAHGRVLPEAVQAVQALERVALTPAIIDINGWNRLAVGFRVPAGEYVSHRHSDDRQAMEVAS